ncbi:MAG: NDP-sugar synthase [Solirubrobacterales bacterium]|nr:NDP-sugar synthase [Solirubrobacterales bacterium]
MQALILAGGQGTRLRPLTESIPKPVLPLAGRPHIAYVIDWLESHGVDDVVISCGFLAEGVRDALDGITGPRVRFATEPEPRGTAGAIRFAADQLGDRFLVLNGDVLCDLDLTALVAQHESTGARATIALFPVDDPSAYGLVRRSEDGAITDFLEKPDPAEIDTDEINAGAYFLERSVLDLIEPGVAASIEREVFPRLVGEGLYGRRLDGYWMDIGTPDRYLQASWDILEGRVETATGRRVGDDGLLVDEGAEVHPDARLASPAMVEAGTTVGAGAAIGPRAVVGPGCSIAERASVNGSVLLSGCMVGAGAKLDGAILSAEAVVVPGAEVEAGAVVAAGERVG